MENSGNTYRTRQAVTACIALIAIAATIILYGVYHMHLLVATGVFAIIIGLDFVTVSFTYSNQADKFGPSEKTFRLISGLIMMVIGAVLILFGYDVSIYVCVAVLIIGIAVIGLSATLIGNKTSKY